MIDLVKRDQIVRAFRRRVWQKTDYIPFFHQAEWQLATEGYTLLDMPPKDSTQSAARTLIYEKDSIPGESIIDHRTINKHKCAVVNRIVIPRIGGVAHVAADLAGYKAGKSYGMAKWAVGYAPLSDAIVQFVGLEYGTSEPEFNYLLDDLLSDRGMNMKYDKLQNDKRGGRMILKLRRGATFEVKSWNQKESLKGATISAYIYTECLPLDAPIWMGDYSTKPIGEVQVGDEVIGWDRQTPQRWAKKRRLSRESLVRTRVTGVKHLVQPLLTIRTSRGRVVQCTKNHQWLVADYRKSSNYAYRYARCLEVGDELATTPIDDSECPAHLRETAAWLAGMYDGEGCKEGITQSRTHNRILCNKLHKAFNALGFDVIEAPMSTSGCVTIRWRGGRIAAMRFLRWVPSIRYRRQYADFFILSQRFRELERIESIEIGCVAVPVKCLTTETSNYIAYGVCSHNCYQLPGIEVFTSISQNLRELDGHAIFGTTADRPWVKTLHDMGHGKDPDFHCTCSVDSRVNPFTFDQRARDRDDPSKGGIMTRERYAIAWEGKLGVFIGRVYAYQRGSSLFTPNTHPVLWPKLSENNATPSAIS